LLNQYHFIKNSKNDSVTIVHKGDDKANELWLRENVESTYKGITSVFSNPTFGLHGSKWCVRV